MPQPNPNRGSQQNSVPIDAETFKSLIDQQSQKLAIEHRKLTLEEKRIDNDCKLAERSMALNADYLKGQPAEDRKTIKTYAIIGVSILLIILAFIFGCLYLGRDAFLLTCLKGIKDVIIAIISFLIGRKTVSKNDSNDLKDQIEDAEIVP